MVRVGWVPIEGVTPWRHIFPMNVGLLYVFNDLRWTFCWPWWKCFLSLFRIPVIRTFFHINLFTYDCYIQKQRFQNTSKCIFCMDRSYFYKCVLLDNQLIIKSWYHQLIWAEGQWIRRTHQFSTMNNFGIEHPFPKRIIDIKKLQFIWHIVEYQGKMI